LISLKISANIVVKLSSTFWGVGEEEGWGCNLVLSRAHAYDAQNTAFNPSSPHQKKKKDAF
jgi:hypothetical protein